MMDFIPVILFITYSFILIVSIEKDITWFRLFNRVYNLEPLLIIICLIGLTSA